MILLGVMEENNVNRVEIEQTVSAVIDSLFPFDNANNDEFLEMETVLDSMIAVINRAIKKTEAKSKDEKLKLIKVADKLSSLKDLLYVQYNKLSSESIQKAGQHLGAKSQSAFEG